jgi:hypothetical protein
MMIALTYLSDFMGLVFRGMPNVWRGRHRLLLCWLIFMHAVSPGRKTLDLSSANPGVFFSFSMRCGYGS